VVFRRSRKGSRFHPERTRWGQTSREKRTPRKKNDKRVTLQKDKGESKSQPQKTGNDFSRKDRGGTIDDKREAG